MQSSISIIIPFYNSGEYLLEALESIIEEEIKYPYEIIIINDGSTEPGSLKVLQSLRDKYLILDKENGGPASARNIGIKNSAASYILALDSDNKIKPEYINEAINYLDKNPDYGVYYGKALFFGNKKVTRQEGDFKLSKILIQNYIDMCAVFRKQVWKDVNGFDENKDLIGHEDWDFWIKIALKGWKFKYINKHMFYYRSNHQSLHSKLSIEKKEKCLRYMVCKYSLLYYKRNRINYYKWLYFKKNPVLYVIKYFLFLLKFKNKQYHLTSFFDFPLSKLIFDKFA